MIAQLESFFELYPDSGVRDAYVELLGLGLDLKFHRELNYGAKQRAIRITYTITCHHPPIIATADTPLEARNKFIRELPSSFGQNRPHLQLVPQRAQEPVRSSG